MTKRRVALELGFGTSLRRESYTDAALRAVGNALWRNSLTVAQAFGFDKQAMIIEVDIACQNPMAISKEAVAAAFPYGQVRVTASFGGLDIDKPDGGGKTVIANAAIVVSFDMEPA